MFLWGEDVLIRWKESIKSNTIELLYSMKFLSFSAKAFLDWMAARSEDMFKFRWE